MKKKSVAIQRAQGQGWPDHLHWTEKSEDWRTNTMKKGRKALHDDTKALLAPAKKVSSAKLSDEEPDVQEEVRI